MYTEESLFTNNNQPWFVNNKGPTSPVYSKIGKVGPREQIEGDCCSQMIGLLNTEHDLVFAVPQKHDGSF